MSGVEAGPAGILTAREGSELCLNCSDGQELSPGGLRRGQEVAGTAQGSG